MIKNLSIRTKVSIAPIVCILLMLIIGAAGIYSNSGLKSNFTQIGTEGIKSLSEVAAMRLKLSELNSSVNQSLAWEGAGFKEEVISTLDKRIVADLGKFAAEIKSASEAASTEDERRLFAAVAADYEAYKKASLDALDIKQGMLSNAASFMTVIDTSFQKLIVSFDRLQAYNRAMINGEIEDGIALANANDKLLVIVILVGAVCASIISFLISNFITSPLEQARQLATKMSSGDFTIKAVDSSTDSTGQVLDALANVSDQLSQMATEIRKSAGEVDTASSEIASSNFDLSERTQNASALLERTSSALEHLAMALKNNAAGAEHANKFAKQTSDAAIASGRDVDGVANSMMEVNLQAKKISEIIGVIDNIAFQTNILALNAAVESARAGEQGRGFAVVAGEVRILAKRSAESAKEIRALITSTLEKVEECTKKAALAGDGMKKVVGSIREVTQAVNQISSETREQATKISEVHSTISHLDRDLQQNAAMVEQAAACAESLKTQSATLFETVSRFKT